jgi:hypothetical protein
MEPNTIEGQVGTALVSSRPPQEWTMRLLALAATGGLTLIGVASVYQSPESPAIVMSCVSALTTLLGSIVGAKAALSTPSETKTQ